MKKRMIAWLILTAILLTVVSAACAASKERIEDFTAEQAESGITVTLPAGYAEKGFFKLFWKNMVSGEIRSAVIPVNTPEYQIVTEEGAEYSFQLFYAHNRGLLPAAWEEEKTEKSQGPGVWKVLWIDADTVDFLGITNRMSEANHRLSEKFSKEFETYVEDLANGQVDIEITRMNLEEPVTKMTYDHVTGYSISADDINMKHYAIHKYDSVFIISRLDGFFIHYSGLASKPKSAREEPGYASVYLIGDDVNYMQDDIVKAVFVHEWLHQLNFFYSRFGLEIPDPDKGSDYGYEQDPTMSGSINEQFFRDVLTMKTHNAEGKYIGVPPEAWHCTPTDHEGIWNLSHLQSQTDPDYQPPEKKEKDPTTALAEDREIYGTLDASGYRNQIMGLSFAHRDWRFALPEEFAGMAKDIFTVSPDIIDFVNKPGSVVTMYAVNSKQPEKAYLGVIRDASFVKQYDETAYLEQLKQSYEEIAEAYGRVDFKAGMTAYRIGERTLSGLKTEYTSAQNARIYSVALAWLDGDQMNTLCVTSAMEDRCDNILALFHWQDP